MISVASVLLALALPDVPYSFLFRSFVYHHVVGALGLILLLLISFIIRQGW